jgi:hypothetical protein
MNVSVRTDPEGELGSKGFLSDCCSATNLSAMSPSAERLGAEQ